MPTKSIGILCSPLGYGGLEMNTLKLAKLLQERGWQVSLLLNASGIMYHNAVSLGLNIATIQYYGGKDFATATVINRWQNDYPSSILFVTFNKDIKDAATYKRFKNRSIKLVYQQHMQVGVKKRDIIHTLRYSMIDLWISPLPYLKEETMAKTRVPSRKITVVPLAVEDFFATETLLKSSARKQLGLAQDAFIIGILGRIDPKKGQDFCIRAMPKLLQLYPDVQLVIMGNITANEGDAFLQKLYTLVAEWQLQDCVHFKPYISNPSVFYKAIDVFAMPAHGETYGMVTLEAMASGVPVVGVNKEGTKELLQSGKYGWLHELEDIDGYTKAIDTIRTEISITEKIAAAKKEVALNFSIDKMMTGIDTALLKLLPNA